MSQTSSTVPSAVDDAVLTAFQELLEAWDKEDYGSVATQCSALLKKRKTLDASLADAIQRLLLQTYIQQEQFSKVVAWSQQAQQQQQHVQRHRDLVTYAKYRLEEYDQVSKQASKDSVLEHHLLAQSLFHLNQPNPALEAYKELLQTANDDDDDEETEVSQMELFTNTLAVLSSSNLAPYCPLPTINHVALAEKAKDFLQQHPVYSDLALNMGILDTLTSHTTKSTSSAQSPKYWFQLAKQLADKNGSNDASISINDTWRQNFWHTDNNLDEESSSYAVSDGTPSAQTSIAKINQALLNLSTNVTTIKSLPVTQPHPKWNPLQVQLYWYNRAIQQYYAKQFAECQESCQSLLKHTDGIPSKKKSSSNNNNNNNNNSSSSTSSLRPLTPVGWWWYSRVEVLLAHVQQSQPKQQQQQQQRVQAVERLEQLYKDLLQQQQQQQSAAVPASEILDHAMAHVQLHLFSLTHTNPTCDEMLALLQSLPHSIRTQPACIATMDALKKEVEAKEKAKSNKTSLTPAEQVERAFEQGDYAQVAELYQAHQKELSNKNNKNEEQLGMQLKLVQALAMSGQSSKATELWETILPNLENMDIMDNNNNNSKDLGEVLESKPLPRSSKPTTLTATATVASNITKEKQNGRSKESIMRQRARKRTVYLQQLEEKGQYNPDRPSKPNPERWIPKQERSRYRRRPHQQQQQQQQSSSSQGKSGFTSAADSWKLDAAARRAGTVPKSTAPTTANLKVSHGTGRKGGGGRR